MDLLPSRRKISYSLLLVLATLLIASTTARHVKKEGQVKEKHVPRVKTKPRKVECRDEPKTCKKQADLAEGKPLVSRAKFSSLKISFMVVQGQPVDSSIELAEYLSALGGISSFKYHF